MQQETSYGEAEFKLICHNLRIPGATGHWKRQTNPFRAFGGIMALPTPWFPAPWTVREYTDFKPPHVGWCAVGALGNW